MMGEPSPLVGNIITHMLVRVQSIKMAGGVSVKEVREGVIVPEGFILDKWTDFYVPSNLMLDDECERRQQ
jgi:hypothetical protein